MTIYKPKPLPTLYRIDSPKGRRYQTPEGKLYPSVTTIFSVLENKSLDAWRKAVGEEEATKISRRAATRGTWIHEQCEYLLKDEQAPKNAISSMLYQSQWNTFKPIVSKIEEVYALESGLYSDKIELAGTVDCVGIWEGKLSIIDFKTSSRRKFHNEIDNYWMQCAAYAIAWWEMTGEPITQLVVLMSVEDEEPLVFVDSVKNWAHKLIEVRKKYKQINGD